MKLFAFVIEILTILLPFALIMALLIWNKRHELKNIFRSEKKILTELIENNPAINRIIGEILNIIEAHRVGLYFSSDYTKGIYLVEKGINGDKIVCTNEVKVPEVSSVMNDLKEVDMFLMNPFIKTLLSKGLIILDKKNKPDNQQIIDIAVNSGVKSIIWVGIYRKAENRNAVDYLIGSVIVSFITNEHIFTKNEIAIINAKCESIAYIVENLYLKHIK